MRQRAKVDVIIPVYKPDDKFTRLVQRLQKQTFRPNRIIVVNTERKYWDMAGPAEVAGLEVHHISKEEFDHGGTRNRAAGCSQAEIMIFMTDDAVPKDRYLVERLVEALSEKGPEGEVVAMAYARQLPGKGCKPVERYGRYFNYPENSQVKTKKDIPRLGIKAYFASNACCAYRKDIFEKQGGFIGRTIFNEDMIYAANAMKAGYAIAYAANAKVIHWHNFTLLQQFRRNFDLAASQASHPEIFAGLLSEGEGMRLVKDTAKWLVKQRMPYWLPYLVFSSGCKYAGYRMGKAYRFLPAWLVRRCSGNREYWTGGERVRENRR